MTSLYSTLKELGLDFNSPDHMTVVRGIVSYLCGVDSAYELQRQLKPVFAELDVPFSPQVFRLELIEKGYFILNIKFMALNLCLSPPTVENVHQFCNDFDVMKNDAVLLRRCFEDNKWRKAMRRSERMQGVKKAHVSVDCLDAAKVDMHNRYDILMKHIRSLCYKRLRFLVSSENSEFSDFHGELFYKAVREYYRMIPTHKPEAHILNSLRLACTNHAKNIIDAKTTNKRRRLYNEGSDGFGGYTFNLKVLSENQAFLVDDGDTVSYESTLNSESIDRYKTVMTQINFERLVQNLGISSVRRRALLIVAGHEDRRFTRFLRDRGVITVEEDCTDFVHRCGFNSVVARLSEHLRVKEDRLRRFLLSVGTQVKKDRSVS